MIGKGPARLLASGCLFFFLFLFPRNVSAVEELKYQVLKKAGDFEIRRYQSCVMAEILLEGGFQKAGNEGFRRLVAYINGENLEQKIIPMTTPVGQEQVEGKWQISFVMPASSTIESLPAPLDPRIKLKEVPAALMAAVRYSGLWSLSIYEAQENRLRDFIRRHGLKITGPSIFARYNSPFMLWFLRRNEVLIPVAQEQ
jgi:hypothetical protein|uniref:Heme-binding protein n=1 Tax=Desulfobacca acetoxidans TaxID=60893 RepID=A0A7V6DR84_9BACT